MTILDRALFLESLHLSVFPLAPRKKSPDGMPWSRWQTERADRQLITNWFSNGGADQNIAVACGPISGVFIVDVDGAEGEAALAALEAVHGPLPPTWRVKTARGRHYWFKDAGFGNSAGKIGDHIDTRGAGGLVVAPGSVHPSGVVYDWEPGFDPEFIELAELPAWIVEKLTAAPEHVVDQTTARVLDFNSAPRQRAAIDNREDYRIRRYLEAMLAGAESDLARTTEGARNQTLNDKAMWLGHFAHYGVYDHDTAWLALSSACVRNGSWADDGDKQCQATFESGWKAGAAEPRDVPEVERPAAGITKTLPAEIQGGGKAYDLETGEIIENIRFKLIAFSEANANLESHHLIKGLIPADGLIVVWGPPKCGKSFWMSDVSMHIAANMPYRGMKVSQGAVVYVAAEGAAAFLGRVQAWRNGRVGGRKDVPFHTLGMRLDLVDDHPRFIADILAQVGQFGKPSLVVIDTLNRTFTGSESSDEDMTAYVKAADAIKAAFGCSVAIIHHCGVEGTRPRGHTSLTGAADTQISILKDGSGVITAKLEWMKDGPEGYENRSRLAVVELGRDQDGDPVTTCLIEPTEEQAMSSSRRLSPGLHLALETLKQAVAEEGEISGQNHIPASARTVPIEMWRKYFYLRSTEEAPDGNQDARKKAFQRAASSLQAKGLIGTWNDLVWAIDK